MAVTNSAPYALAIRSSAVSFRDLAELIVGFAGIMVVLWLPTREQLIVGPIALLAPLTMVLWRRPGINQLGFGWRGFATSF